MNELLSNISAMPLLNYLITFAVSMLPVVELRGGIPLGVSLGLNHWVSMVLCIIGNLVPVPFIILFIRRILDWLQGKSARLARLVQKLEAKADSPKAKKIYKSEVLGLILFVAIPLPGTGAWTGALIASLLGIRIKTALPAIAAGVVIAGFLITGITFGFTEIFT